MNLLWRKESPRKDLLEKISSLVVKTGRMLSTSEGKNTGKMFRLSKSQQKL